MLQILRNIKTQANLYINAIWSEGNYLNIDKQRLSLSLYFT